jgi:hypothetical protein
MECTFVGAAGDENLRVDIEVVVEGGAIVLLDRLAETDAALGVGVVVFGDTLESSVCGLSDPFRRGKIHVALAHVYAVGGEIDDTGGTMSDQGRLWMSHET